MNGFAAPDTAAVICSAAIKRGFAAPSPGFPAHNFIFSESNLRKILDSTYARIEKYFPVQRGNVKIDNYTFINAILYIAENGCKWRALPEKYGKWNSIYQRFKRWCENGVIQRIFNALQQEKIIAIKVEVLALDSTSCKLHPDAHGALKNTDNNVSGNQRADGIPSFTWYPQMTRSLSKCTYPVETVTTPHKEESQLKT